MNKLTPLLFLLLVIGKLHSQELKVDFSYKYMYAHQWDKAIQTYNFSRPFLAEKQPLLMHGLNGSATYLFPSEKQLSHGIHLSYTYCRSAAENENFNTTLNLHFVNIGYVLHLAPTEKFKGFYSDVILSATSSILHRRTNEVVLVDDETKLKALGIGGDLSLKVGYRLKLGTNSFLSPFLALGYTPYFYSPATEAVINQTKTLSSKNWTGILTAQVGVAVCFKRSVVNGN